MSSQTYLAVDLGAESGRVVAGQFDGRTLQLTEVHRFANEPVKVLDTLHWDTLRLFHEIKQGIRKAVAGCEGEIAGVSTDTWGVDFGLLDKHDGLIANPVHYRDHRNDGMADKVFDLVPNAEVYGRTGIQFLPFNTLFQLMGVETHQPDQLQAARTLLFTPDLLNFWLSGEKRAEYTIASTGQVLEACTRQWDLMLFDQLGLPAGILPQLVAPGTMLGNLRPTVAAELGLAGAIPVIAAGSHDTASAVAAVPAGQANWAYLSSGTWSLLGVELAEPLLEAKAMHLGFTNEGGVANTIRFLRNIMGLWLLQECRRSWQRSGTTYSYDELVQAAAQAPPFQSLVNCDDPSFLAPEDMPAALGDYCVRTGQPAPQSVPELVRCCLESLALRYRATVEDLQQLTGQHIEVLHIVGGGSKNRLLSQWTADCLGIPVQCGPVEATAAGNILVQAMARGQIKDLAQIREVVRQSFPVETLLPVAAEKARWDDAFQRITR